MASRAALTEKKLLGTTVSPEARKSEASLDYATRVSIYHKTEADLRDKIDRVYATRYKPGTIGDVTTISHDATYRDLTIGYMQGRLDQIITPSYCYIPNYAKYTLRELYTIWTRHAAS